MSEDTVIDEEQITYALDFFKKIEHIFKIFTWIIAVSFLEIIWKNTGNIGILIIYSFLYLLITVTVTGFIRAVKIPFLKGKFVSFTIAFVALFIFINFSGFIINGMIEINDRKKILYSP
jgi:hypothetical protein